MSLFDSLRIKSYKNEIKSLKKQINSLKKELVSIDEQVSLESYGLYKPRYDFAKSSDFKEKLTQIRNNQKQMIKDNKAGIVTTAMTLNNSKVKGRAMQRKNIKQLVRSFNVECEAAINKVTKTNFERIKNRIIKSFEQLNKLNEPNGVQLSNRYLQSKIDEAHLALEFELKKAEENELLREQKEREKEEEKLRREIANERKKYEKDEAHFEKAVTEVQDKINNSSNDEEILSLKQQLKQLQSKLADIQTAKQKLSNRAENPTAGYVYIISNIGSFGKNVYKIGVTRRLNPLDRINELGSASVPFKFDVHALIFSENAYKLETELHNRFNDKRVNQINHRKEYFNITIDDIKDALSDYKDLTFDFNEIPEAEEYRESLKIINKSKI